MRIGIGAVAILSLCVLAVCSTVSDASGYGGAPMASPVRSATTPLSSYQSGLVSRPNPLDSSGNLVVTGNVGAGKHFRGPVPYRSTTSMSAPLGSTSLDSFMRYTAAPATPRSSAGTYGAFYSPTRTVTSTLPGTRSVSTPSTLRVGSGAVQRQEARAPDALYSDLRSRPLLSADAGSLAGDTSLDAVPRLRVWPLSETPDPTTRNMSKRFGKPLTDGRLSPPRSETVTGRDYKQQMEALQQRLGEVKAELSALEQSLAVSDEPSQFPAESPYRSVAEGLGLPQSPETPMPTAYETLGTEASPSQSRKDELLQETARLLAATTGLPAPGISQDNTAPLDANIDDASMMSTNTATRLQLYPEVKVSGTFFQQTAGSDITAQRKKVPDTLATTVVQPSVQNPVWRLEKEKVSPSPKAFERHFQAARQHSQRGRYKQAADAFTLASAYRPNDPRSYLGKSHALFASGEYIGSALALTKAVELDPKYALQKSDLVWIAGGPDSFIARFNALDEVVQADATPHLQFLLAYIYYQMDRPQAAQAAIDAAKRALPSSPSVDLLKVAIDR